MIGAKHVLTWSRAISSSVICAFSTTCCCCWHSLPRLAPLVPTLTLTRSGLAPKRPLDEEHARWLAEVSSFWKVDAGATNASTPHKAATPRDMVGSGWYGVRVGLATMCACCCNHQDQASVDYHSKAYSSRAICLLLLGTYQVPGRRGRYRYVGATYTRGHEGRSYATRTIATGVTEIKKVSLPRSTGNLLMAVRQEQPHPAIKGNYVAGLPLSVCPYAASAWTLLDKSKGEDDTCSTRSGRLLICEIGSLDKVEKTPPRISTHLKPRRRSKRSLSPRSSY